MCDCAPGEHDRFLDNQLRKRFGPAGVAKIEREAHHVYHARQELREL